MAQSMDDIANHNPVESAKGVAAGESPAVQSRALDSGNGATDALRATAGEGVNRFAFCALVNRSAKHIKARAEEAGVHLPMTMVVRGVLRSYRRMAEGRAKFTAADIAGLRRLNAQILKDEIARHIQEGVNYSRVRLADASRLGDEAKIQAAKVAVDYAISDRTRIFGELKIGLTAPVIK